MNLCATGDARDGGGADGKARIEKMCISFLMSKKSLRVFKFRDSYVLYVYMLSK